MSFKIVRRPVNVFAAGVEMFTRISLSTIIVLAAVVWGGLIWLLGVDLSWRYVTPLGAVVTIVSLLVAIFNRVLWAWPPFSWFAGVPDLRGDWEVSLKSNYIDPATQQPKEPVQGTAVIRQTFSTLSIRVVTGTQTSFLIAHNIIRHTDEVYELTGVYQSDPDLELRGGESEIHYGAFKYSIDGPPVNVMKGHYWTDRNTRGKIQLRRKSQRTRAAARRPAL